MKELGKEMELLGKRKRGRPKRRFLDVVKDDMGKLVQGRREIGARKLVQGIGVREKDRKQDAVKEHHMLWQPLIKGKGQK